MVPPIGQACTGPHLQHRSEIEGLRALAVIPVVLFHADVPGFGGGFAGVDIFFVISGYLITATLVEHAADSGFGLRAFYERRLRRLVPALLPVLAVSTALASMLFIAEDWRKFGQALAASSVFAANFLFARSVDYFDDNEGFQPLLHLWSLAVEEQFYLLFPLAVTALVRQRPSWLLPVLSGVMGTSFLLAVILAASAPQIAFFMLPFRAWELMAGAICATPAFRAIEQTDGWRRSFRLVGIDTIGLGLILIGFVVIDRNTPVPGLAFALPVLGTALVILGNGRATLVNRLLSAAPVAALGSASYGIYLWHHPLLAFAGYIWFGPLPWPITACMLLLACGLGFASLHLIERPVRQGKRLGSHRVLIFVCVAGLGLAFAAGIAAYAVKPHGPVNAAADVPSRAFPDGPLPYIVYGDSHARQYVGALAERFGPGAVLTQSACLSLPGLANVPPENPDATACATMVEKLVTTVHERHVRTIYWAQRWDRELYPVSGNPSSGTVGGAGAPAFLAALRALAERLPADTSVVLVGNVPTAAAGAPQLAGGLARCQVYLNTTCPVQYPRKQAEGAAINHLLARIAATNVQMAFVDTTSVLCRDMACQIIDNAEDHGRAIYADGTHLTPWAAQAVVALFPAPTAQRN